MPRSINQSKVTFTLTTTQVDFVREESELSRVNQAELIRRAIDAYLTLYVPPLLLVTQSQLDPQGGTGSDVLPEVKKYPLFINDGLYGELHRYAGMVNLSIDEVVNRALLLYDQSVTYRRAVAEQYVPGATVNFVEGSPDSDEPDLDPDEPALEADVHEEPHEDATDGAVATT